MKHFLPFRCRLKPQHQDTQAMFSNKNNITVPPGIEMPSILSDSVNSTDRNQVDDKNIQPENSLTVIRAQADHSTAANDPITIHITLGVNSTLSRGVPSNVHHTRQLSPGVAGRSNMNVVVHAPTDNTEELPARATEHHDQMELDQGNNFEYAYADGSFNALSRISANQPDVVPIYEDISFTGYSNIRHQYMLQPSINMEASLNMKEVAAGHECIHSMSNRSVPDPPKVIRFGSSPNESLDELTVDNTGGYVNSTKFL